MQYKLNFHIYELCNMNCQYCFRPNKTEGLNLNWKQAIDQISNNKNINYINIAGGEPTLLKKELLEILEYINAKRLKSSIISNGIILYKDQELLLNILKYVDCVGVSVDSLDPKICNLIGRVTKGSKETMTLDKLKVIEELTHQQGKKFKVNIVYSSLNKNDISLASLKELKIDRLKILFNQYEMTTLVANSNDFAKFMTFINPITKPENIVIEKNMNDLYLMLNNKLELSTRLNEKGKSIFQKNVLDEAIKRLNENTEYLNRA